jgi:hypothetical protein
MICRTILALAAIGVLTGCAVEETPLTDGSAAEFVQPVGVDEATENNDTFCSASNGQTLCSLDLLIATNAPVGLQFDLNYDVDTLQLKGFSCEKDGADPCAAGTVKAGHQIKYAQNDNGARVLVVSFSSTEPMLAENGTLMSAVFEGQGGNVGLSDVVVSDAKGQPIDTDWQEGTLTLQ